MAGYRDYGPSYRVLLPGSDDLGGSVSTFSTFWRPCGLISSRAGGVYVMPPVGVTDERGECVARMATEPSIFVILQESADPAADDALLAALQRAEPPTALAVIETLLVRQSRRGLFGLVEGFHLLDEPLRQAVILDIDRLFGVLREAAQSRDEQIRLNVLALIREGRLFRATYLLDGCFRDRSISVREAAAETLHHLAEALLKSSADAAGDDMPVGSDLTRMPLDSTEMESRAEDRRQLVGAIEAGLTTFDLHRQSIVVEVAMWFADDLGAASWAVFSAPGSRAAQAAMTLLANSPSPRFVPFAMATLASTNTRSQIAHLLNVCPDAPFLTEWTRQSWRLIQPKLARALIVVRELAWIDRRVIDLSQVPAEFQRLYPRWLLATGLAPKHKTDALKEFYRRADRTGRQAVVWALTHWFDPRADSFLRSLALQSDPELSGIARMELARRRPGDYPISALIPADAQLGGARKAREAQPSPMTLERYWETFDCLNDQERVSLGREMLDRAPEARRNLALRLGEPSPARRVRALRMMTVLGLVGEFEEHVYPLCHDPEAEVRSAAVAALGTLPSPTSRRLLNGALRDRDGRVQANAIEAVDRLGGVAAASGELRLMLKSPDNRVRANAVRVLLKLGVRDAAETLLSMMVEKDRAQRISALWLIENMGLFNLAKRVARMAVADADSQVRTRARGLIEQLASAASGSAIAPPAGRRAVKEVTAR